jgi:hypothetical protein
MHRRTVERAALQAGIGLAGLEVQIEADPELVGRNLFGYTNPAGTIIILYPDAFTDEEELVKTLGHERIHVYQARTFGPPGDSVDALNRERAAVATEETWWRSYRGAL